MKKSWSEVFGWYGVAAILLAYLLNSLNIINSANLWYSMLNFTGAIGVIVDAGKQKNYQPMVLNLVWGLVALVAIFRGLML